MKYLDVATWEFLEKIKSKAFLISLVLMPVIMVGFGILPGMLAMRSDEEITVIGFIDETNGLHSVLAKRLTERFKLPNGQPNYELRNLKDSDGSIEMLKARANRLIADREIEGYLLIPATVYDSGYVEYRSENVSNIRVLERLGRTIEEVVAEKKLADHGFDPDVIRKLKTDVDIKPIKVSEKGEETGTGFMETFFSMYIYVMMLMFMVLTSGQLLIRSVVEEKSSRVIEVLLSSCSSRDLMVGKILGLSALGIAQILIWGIIGTAMSLKFGSNLFLTGNLSLSLVFFILGYMLYAAIFVGAGSPVTSEQEAQQITSYVSLLLVSPIVLAFPVMQNPDSLFVKILTFIPLLTPAFMLLRIPIQMPETWEILTAVGILLFSVIVCMWAAGKIFRVAILVYGKRPTLPELYRWIRTP